jgi:hypothetical protein
MSRLMPNDAVESHLSDLNEHGFLHAGPKNRGMPQPEHARVPGIEQRGAFTTLSFNLV